MTNLQKWNFNEGLKKVWGPEMKKDDEEKKCLFCKEIKPELNENGVCPECVEEFGITKDRRPLDLTMMGGLIITAIAAAAIIFGMYIVIAKLAEFFGLVR